MEDQVDALDKRSDFLSSHEIGLDELAVGIDVFFFPSEKIVGTYYLVPLVNKIVNQPGAHETCSSSH